jgi:hypothetical protein
VKNHIDDMWFSLPCLEGWNKVILKVFQLVLAFIVFSKRVGPAVLADEIVPHIVPFVISEASA